MSANAPIAADSQITDAEQALLGSLLIDPTAIQRIGDQLEPSDFWLPNHQMIYAAMLRLRESNRPTDFLMVTQELNGDVESAGGIPYIFELGNRVPFSYHAPYYAEQVQEHSRRRLLMGIGSKLNGGVTDADEALEMTEAQLTAVRQKKRNLRWEPKGDSLHRLNERLSGPAAEDDSFSTGLLSLDRLTRGMRPGDLVICGARPGVGKTSFAVTIAHHVALNAKRPVAFFSLEMLRDRIWEKLCSIDSGVPWRTLTSHAMSELDQRAKSESLERIGAAPIDIVPAREWTIQAIRTAAREMHRKEPLALIVVDYLQLAGYDGKTDNRVQEVAAISANLKGMALELECCVLALSQLNREPEHRPKSEPLMSELKESGSQEQDADIVLLLSKPKDLEDTYERLESPVREIVTQVAKNRLGECGKIRLGFMGARMQFVELDRTRPNPRLNGNGHKPHWSEKEPDLEPAGLGF